MMECDMAGMTTGGMLGMMGLGLLGTILLIAALAGVVYLLARSVFGWVHAGREDGAITELRRAYARGDVSDEEFDRRRKVLAGDR